MIATLTGTVAAIRADSLVLEAGGVGYRVFVGPSHAQPARVGEQLHLHTHHLVREDLQALYGFRSDEELGFFELLMTVTGVGPQGGPGHRLVARRGRPAAGHPAGRRGRPDGRQRGRQAARGAHRAGAQGEGRRGRRRRRAGGVAAAPRRRSWRRSRPWATPRGEAREAARDRRQRQSARVRRSRSASRPPCGPCAATERRAGRTPVHMTASQLLD